MCGEKREKGYRGKAPVGSPPHVRGKGQEKGYCAPLRRITPACAGKRVVVASVGETHRDHPRMCGEKPYYTTLPRGFQGSPPHVRGKVRERKTGKTRRGITPACAGKRLKRSRSTVPHAAIVPLFPSVCNKPAGSDGSPAGHDAPPFLPIENAAPASPAYNLRSL